MEHISREDLKYAVPGTVWLYTDIEAEDFKTGICKSLLIKIDDKECLLIRAGDPDKGTLMNQDYMLCWVQNIFEYNHSRLESPNLTLVYLTQILNNKHKNKIENLILGDSRLKIK